MSTGTVNRRKGLIEFREYHRRCSKFSIPLLILVFVPFFQFYRFHFLYPVGLNLSVSGNRSLQYFSLFLFSFWKTAPCCNGLLSRHFRERSYLCLSLKMGISSFSKTSGNGPTHYTVLSSENGIICFVVIFSF